MWRIHSLSFDLLNRWVSKACKIVGLHRVHPPILPCASVPYATLRWSNRQLRDFGPVSGLKCLTQAWNVPWGASERCQNLCHKCEYHRFWYNGCTCLQAPHLGKTGFRRCQIHLVLSLNIYIPQYYDGFQSSWYQKPGNRSTLALVLGFIP